MTAHILPGLLARRAEMVREVRAVEGQLQQLLANIEHLDRAIVLFDPDHIVRAPSISATGAGGHITRVLLDILRKSPEPMTLRALTLGLMQSVGLDHKSPRRVVKAMEQCRRALTRQLANGTVAKEMGRAGALVWRIAR